MKSVFATTCLAFCLLAFVTAAGAQEIVNFSDLPLVSVPAPMPSGYGQLEWSNFFYVDPFTWSDSGPGFQLGVQKRDVAFIGSRYCRLIGYACFGTLSHPIGFQLVSATIAGGSGPTTFTVTAYNHGNYVGAANYFATTQLQTIQLPQQWGPVTELVFQVFGASGHLAVYEVRAYTLGG